MDSDLIVNADIAELFDTDVTGYLLGATRDADTLGQMDGYDVTVGDEAASRQAPPSTTQRSS